MTELRQPTINAYCIFSLKMLEFMMRNCICGWMNLVKRSSDGAVQPDCETVKMIGGDSAIRNRTHKMDLLG